MNSTAELKLYFSNGVESHLPLFQNREKLVKLLDNQCLLLLLRFVENFEDLALDQRLKTLILLVELYKENPQKIKSMLPYHSFRKFESKVSEDPDNRTLVDLLD